MSVEVLLDNKIYNVEKIKTVDTRGIETKWVTENTVNNIISLENPLNVEVQAHTLIVLSRAET